VKTRVHRVVTEGELEAARASHAVPCTTQSWGCHAAGTCVFVFTDIGDALEYGREQLQDALRQPPDRLFLISVNVDDANLFEDLSADRVNVPGNVWRSSRAHRGPIPFSGDEDIVPLSHP
jgi:hypothetical protein